MKKINLITSSILILILAVVLIGCGNTEPLSNPIKPDHERIYEEFVEIYKLSYYDTSYAYNGNIREIYSTYSISFDSEKQITEEEYNTIPIQFNLQSPPSGTYNFTKDKKTPNIISNLNIGDFVAFSAKYSLETTYYKKEYISTFLNLLSAKIIDNKTVIIKNNTSQHIISTEYFNIEFFTN